MIDLVIFDLDGTLLDTSEGVLECVRYAADTMGYPPLPREELLTFIGPPLTLSFPKHYGMDEAAAWEAIRLFREHYVAGAILKAVPYAGICQLCRDLQARGTAMAVATNKVETQAVRLLTHFGFERFCSPIRGADPAGRLKKADLIRLCLEERNTAPENAVLMGDTLFDAEGAAAAGVGFLAVTYGFGFHCRQDAAPYATAGIAATPEEAAELICRE